ncbi:MAG: S1 RNA-binding domain-containing protein [Polyangia bacterium]
MLAQFEQEQGTGAPNKNKADKRRSIGTEVRGRVLSIGRDYVFVDLGGKDDGLLPVDEVRQPDGSLSVKVGDEVVARIAEVDGRMGGLVLRRVMGRGPEARAELFQAFEAGIPVEGQISGVVKGGVEVQIAGVRAFCPISQLDLRHVEDATPYVGQKHRFRITRCEEQGRSLNLVVSRRSLLEEEQQEQAAVLRKQLGIGVVLRGRVTAIKDYGAFVDLGGIEGMLHVSELSFQRARHPKDVLSLGQEIEVQIIRLEQTDDPRKPEKISLSLKSLEKDPWSDIETRFPEGSRTTGTVLRTEAFGAIVEIEPGVEGLLHISELGKGKKLRHAKEATNPGDRVDVVVQMIDREKRRMSLVSTEGGRGVEFEAPPPSAVNAPARFGTFGDLLKNMKVSPKK